jgi:pimeloyl-ACP methyl ester carboxylesterase
MADYVLIHGAWHGGWCWAEVARGLVQRGHRVFAPSLTGCADRGHLLSPQVTLGTHVEDVVRLIEFESLDGCVLVGHSYGGNVISGVADRLRERVGHYVFLDAGVPPDDATRWSWSQPHSEATRASRREQIQQAGRGLFLPQPPAQAFGITDASQAAWLEARLSPMPAGLYDTPIELHHGASRGLRRTYVAATAPVYETMRSVQERLRSDGSWTFLEIATCHDMMVTAPAEVVNILHDCR